MIARARLAHAFCNLLTDGELLDFAAAITSPPEEVATSTVEALAQALTPAEREANLAAIQAVQERRAAWKSRPQRRTTSSTMARVETFREERKRAAAK